MLAPARAMTRCASARRRAIREERRQLGRDAGGGIGGAHAVQVLGAALLRDHAGAAQRLRQARRRPAPVGEDARAEQPPVTSRRSAPSVPRIAARRRARPAPGAPGCRSPSPAPAGTRPVSAIGQRQRSAPRRQQPVGAAEHGVLLVQHGTGRRPSRSRRQHRRHGGIAAEADHRGGPSRGSSRAPPACRPPAPARRAPRCSTPRPARPAPRSTKRSALAKAGAVEGRRARIGHQRDPLAARAAARPPAPRPGRGARPCRRRR